MIIVKKPKIRFKGFTETWEQRKLGNIMEVASVKRIHRKDWTDSGVRFLRARDIVSHFKNEKQNDCLYISKEKYDECSALSGKVSVGDLLVTGVGTIGIPYLVNDLNPIYFKDGNIIWFKNGSKINGFFLYYSFIGNEIQNFINVLSGTGTVGTYTIESGKKTSISLPDKLEQQKIGNFLKHLDHLITLHQRKCENLKKLKKFMLQKLFPQNGENVPKVRFLNFTDTWEQRKLETYLQEYNEVTSTNNQYPALTSSRKGLFLQTDYFSGNQVASENNIGYNVVPYGYFTYRHMSDDEVFHFNLNDIVDKGIVSTLYPVFTTSKELDSKYLQYQLNYGEEFSRFARLQKQGGSRTYMYLNKLRKLSLTMPNTLDEQKEISAILSTLDHFITLHQSKCDKLKEVKKYMLQNMFI